MSKTEEAIKALRNVCRAYDIEIWSTIFETYVIDINGDKIEVDDLISFLKGDES